MDAGDDSAPALRTQRFQQAAERAAEEFGMIRLTRLNTQPVIVNSDLVKFVEQAPDTLITLVNGEKFMVRESVDQVVERIVEFRRSVLRGIFPAWDRVAGSAALSEPEGATRHPEQRER